MSGRFSYPGIMEAAYGKWGYYLLSVLQFMYPFLGEFYRILLLWCAFINLRSVVNKRHCHPHTLSMADSFYYFTSQSLVITFLKRTLLFMLIYLRHPHTRASLEDDTL